MLLLFLFYFLWVALGLIVNLGFFLMGSEKVQVVCAMEGQCVGTLSELGKVSTHGWN